MGATPKLDLYVDDLGSRRTDLLKGPGRLDGVDAFALGGFLCRSEEAHKIASAVEEFRNSWRLQAALHSNEIRGERKNFAWLREIADTERRRFHSELAELIAALPIHVLVVAVDRPNYNERYGQKYGVERWQYLCRSAYPILLERSCKFACARERKLEVFVEECGKREDRLLRDYHRRLLKDGHEFDATTSGRYGPLQSTEMSSIALGRPRFVKKRNPLIQVADLVLYPMVKGGYDPDYRAYRHLIANKKRTDDAFDHADSPIESKYYCFKQNPA